MYDLIVIGAGPGGYTAAIKAAKSGLKTAIIEASSAGGTCLNKGCIPTKYLISEMHTFTDVQKNISEGFYSGKVTVDYKKIRNNLTDRIAELSNGIDWLLRNCGVDVISGYAEFVDETHIRINDIEKVIEGKNIIIATGSAPRTMDVYNSKSYKNNRVFTTDNIFTDLDCIPESITIIGAGAVGLELAFIYSGFGSKVTILEQRKSLFDKIDSDIDIEVMKMLKRKSINIILGCTIDSIFENEDDISVFDDNEDEISKSEIIIFAIGRIPNISKLKLECANVITVDGRISVDDNMKTNVNNIYAIGDVNGIQPLAYVASAQAENVISHICKDVDFKNLSVVPMCIFTDIEIAYTGLTIAEAEAKEIDIKTSKFLMSANGRSKIDENGGFIKIIADKETDVILGGVCVCHNASDLISYITYAVNNKSTTEQFTSVIFPHPTYSESLSEAVGLVNNKCIHML